MTSNGDLCVYGEVTRNLRNLFQRYAGKNGVLNQSKIRPALLNLNLFPSKIQIHDLVNCACVSSGRMPVDHVTFGEFCLFATELQECYRKSETIPQHPRSLVRDKHHLDERRRKRKLSGHGAHFKVFLGGSCNPTTWRRDDAIPFFKSHGVTYFNPQVSNWQKDFMELEDRAKQTAELLFFVIDKQTRSTASMVEATYLAGCGRKLILVIKDLEGPGSIIAGEPISVVEYEDLMRSHAVLTDIVERQGYPVFSTIENALHCTRKVIQENISVSQLTLADGAQPVKHAHARVADTIIRLKDAFNQVDHTKSGRLSLSDVNLAYKTMTDQNLPNISELEDTTFTFEQFCTLYAECRHKKKTWWRKVIEAIMRLPTLLFDWFRGTSDPKETEDLNRTWDVFLGGTCGGTTWRETKVIPALRKHGLTAYNPQFTDWNTHYLPLEANRKNRCRLLLYVITGDTRGITSMLEASHHIGQGCDVVLCIQHLEDGVAIDNEKLTPTGIADYNRARTYLADLANRDGIPIFDNIDEATECVIQKIIHSDQ